MSDEIRTGSELAGAIAAWQTRFRPVAHPPIKRALQQSVGRAKVTVAVEMLLARGTLGPDDLALQLGGDWAATIAADDADGRLEFALALSLERDSLVARSCSPPSRWSLDPENPVVT